MPIQIYAAFLFVEHKHCQMYLLFFSFGNDSFLIKENILFLFILRNNRALVLFQIPYLMSCCFALSLRRVTYHSELLS